MGILEKIRLLAEWSPLISYLQSLADEDDVHARVVLVSGMLEFVADRTATEWDDELCKHITEVLTSEEGESLVRWVVEQLKPDDADA